MESVDRRLLEGEPQYLSMVEKQPLAASARTEDALGLPRECVGPGPRLNSKRYQRIRSLQSALVPHSRFTRRAVYSISAIPKVSQETVAEMVGTTS
jgi:hypothetical protein